MIDPWWRRAVVYQVYPRSFADGNGDGVGDLPGVIERVPYLAWLGIDAIWLSPIYRSPMADFGYDVSDHCDVDPVFGSLDDVDRLLTTCHEHGIRVLLDWVPNHTSDQHPWFLESRRDRSSPKRSWYVWRDGLDGSRPNNWRAAFGGAAWTWDAATEQWYLHLFLPQQPDLNWSEPAVVEAQHRVLRFWLDRGVDGFRADVVHLIGKDPTFPDVPDDLVHVDLVGIHDHPRTHELLRGIRSVLDSYPGSRPMVGEVNLHGADRLAPYYGRDDELHLVFNFALLGEPWDVQRWAATVADAERAFGPVGGWPVWVLSNHDERRHRTRYGGSERRARVAAAVLLTLRGTPFLYAGEELGLEDAAVDPSERVDPGGRDPCRAPVPWTGEAGHGWGLPAWLPFPTSADARNVAGLTADEGSILHLYRRLLAARRASPALHAGAWTVVHVDDHVLVYDRTCDDDRRRVAANFSLETVHCPMDGAWVVEVDTDDHLAGGRRWTGDLRGEHAVVLRPA